MKPHPVIERLEAGHEHARLIPGPTGRPPAGRQWTRRLTWAVHDSMSLNWDSFIQTQSQEFNCDSLWFLDSNMYIHSTPLEFWKYLFGRRHRLAFRSYLFDELKRGWLKDPRGVNLFAHSRLQSSVRSGWHEIGNNRDNYVATYYTNLLGMRKNLADIARDQIEKCSSSEPSEAEISDFVLNKFGRRALNLEKKVRHKDKSNTDELLLVDAMLSCICHGREVIVMTRDKDVLEQFYKLMWLVDTHYRSMLLARAYARDPLPYGAISHPPDPEVFDGEIRLIKKPSDTLQEVLDTRFSSVSMHCFHVEGDSIRQLSFCAEREMEEVLNVKYETNGLNTPLFEGKNLHIDIGPLNQKLRLPSNSAVIAKDAHGTLSSTHYSLVDVNLVLNVHEGLESTVYRVGGGRILQPPRTRLIVPNGRLIHIPRHR